MNEQDWEAVAEAIRERMQEIHIGQRELADSTGVSAATIRELMYNYKPRRRSTRTLRAISVGLEWSPDYVESVLYSRAPVESSAAGDATVAGVAVESKTISAQLNLVLRHVDEIRADVRDLKEMLTKHKRSS
ncbi:XRE family transcriptional regulator [Amycolatopsis alkalitolerans]|uniref:XRE family transcriptional regulator n=1 Tax=Amycolatopsis alkalitolerans TaxID=2547244 RepID=A0A5C4M2J1_9PSEU|nr:XRE family transcriptional regulator [Amycolatopsis alkalitolerans]TNC26400.1 XRE family transcriptional regulator [Amycolatopsis alkalitolerans]